MAVKFTSLGSLAQITMDAGLQTLADNTAAESSAAMSNDDSTERQFFRNFAVKVGTQGSARAADATVHLVLTPYLGTIQGDAAALNADGISNQAYDKDGNPVIWYLDAAVTARDLTWANVSLPNSDYYVGVVNRTGQAFAGTNEVWGSGAFSVENVS